jgi:AraC family transcriptional regulator of adaptative response/methylated-DNA-[protein]-cysteine methyltransferase
MRMAPHVPVRQDEQMKSILSSGLNSIDDERWRAVTIRDRRADGLFVYAVISTGIYCRPSCPSRRPRRERAAFFLVPADAERGGFRACKRCRPEAAGQADPWVRTVSRACTWLARREGGISLAGLAEHVGGSRFHLHRAFKRLVGLTPRQYADACRFERVKRALQNGTDVTGAVVDAGYGSNSRFYERAAPMLGMPPAVYRRGGADVKVRYTIVDAPLGRLLVAATDRGICAVAIGASDAGLKRSLAREYPRATLADAPGPLAKWAAQIVSHLSGRSPHLDLPLDIQATSFQWQVWRALAAIPYGSTRSYGEVAATIGRPTAARAVARACATNPAALVVPCHRVVPKAGGVGGYRWGVARKKTLLASEKRYA